MAIKQNLPKSYLATQYLKAFLGARNMVILEGDRHKALRAMFNPGFSQKHLLTYVDAIVKATEIFNRGLQQKAKSNELFELEELATRLTIDVIGMAVFGVELNSQVTPHPIVKYFRERSGLMPPAEAYFPW